jgi:methylated-DNA-[protein]-cysteine S-methyltransferase
MDMDSTARTHTRVSTALGELTLVRDEEALLGVYYRNHWGRPDPSAFGPRNRTGFDEAVAQLDAYLAGRRTAFDLLVRLEGDEFQQRVWSRIQRVPYGATVTYGALARELGDGTTAQEVGAAVGRNPLCIVVPCHRVVGAAGKLTGYAGGLARKRLLIDLEQTGVAAGDSIRAV